MRHGASAHGAGSGELWWLVDSTDYYRAPRTPRAIKVGVESVPVSPMSGVIKAVEVISLVSPTPSPSPAPLRKRLQNNRKSPLL